MDSGVKLFVVAVLGILPFFITSYASLVLVASYFLLATFLFGIRFSEMKKSMAAYIIFILVPYGFGLLIAILVSGISGSDPVVIYSYQGVTLRMLRLFLLWYATSLYFHSTPTEDVIGVFERLLSPLKRIGVPVSDSLKIVMCVTKELKNLAPNVQKSFTESMEQISKNASLKSKITAISYMLVSFIVNSFQRLEDVEDYVRQVDAKDLFAYKCSIAKSELLLVLSLMLLVGSTIWLEIQVF